jgi:hypothetical protein
MAILKVLIGAVLLGVLFALSSAVLLDWIEKSVGRGAPVVQIALGCVGALLGAIAGAAQAVVDAIEGKSTR